MVQKCTNTIETGRGMQIHQAHLNGFWINLWCRNLLVSKKYTKATHFFDYALYHCNGMKRFLHITFLIHFILTRWNMVFTSFKKYFLGYTTTRWGMIRLHASVNIKSGSKLYSTPNHENKYAIVIAGFFKSVIHQSAFIHQSSRLHRNFLEVLTYVTC